MLGSAAVKTINSSVATIMTMTSTIPSVPRNGCRSLRNRQFVITHCFQWGRWRRSGWRRRHRDVLLDIWRGGAPHKVKGVSVLIGKRAGIQCLQGIEMNDWIVLGKVIGS